MGMYGRYHRAIDSVAKQESAIENIAFLLNTAPHVVVTGVGKSYGIAQHAASLFQSVGVKATAVHATDMFHGGLAAVSPGTIVVCISNSGETKEIVWLMEYISGSRLTVGVTRDVLSPVGVLADYLLTYACEKDGSAHETIPSVSAVGQLVILSQIACVIADRKTREELASGHPGGYLYKEEA